MTFRNLFSAGRTAAIAAAAATVALTAPVTASAQGEPQSLEQLLEQTRTARAREQRANEARVNEFRRNRNEQRDLLRNAQRELAALNARAAELNAEFDANETKLSELETTQDARSGALGEIVGTVRQFAGDMFSAAQSSMTSAQLGPARLEFLSDLSGARRLPDTEKLDRLYYEMLREITELGRVVKFDATVIDGDGSVGEREVVRIGTFTAIAGDQFLTYAQNDNPERRFSELARQPSATLVNAASDFAKQSGGYHDMYVDPSAGTLLSAESRKRNLIQRVQESEAGAVGWVIIALTVLGILIALLKFLQLTVISGKVASQKRNPGNPSEKNALGRVMTAYYKDPHADTETLELRLDEAVLKETPRLQFGLGAIKILAAVGPLLGLLGTVTGMIEVFQQMTLFGTGDPKLMAGGISQALMTTVLGLVMAIPLVLLHALLSARANAIEHTLEQQSVGLIAEHNETPAAAEQA